jgi:hypothetical protein
MHFVSACCKGEFCGICRRSSTVRREATHKVEEVIFDDQPGIHHNLTQYVCCEHFMMIFGSAANCD